MLIHFLQKKLREKQIEYSNVTMRVKEGTRAKDSIRQVHLSLEDVEVVFINGKVTPFDTMIEDKDQHLLKIIILSLIRTLHRDCLLPVDKYCLLKLLNLLFK